MKKTKFSLALLVIKIALLSGCASSELVLDKEYEKSTQSFNQGDFIKATESFPEKEQGGFLTSIEKGWIHFWKKEKFEPIDLQKQVNTFERRKFVSISREAQYFLYQESEEGYVPSEHEVIILHLVSAMLYMNLGAWDSAKVEARRASYFIQGSFNENQKHFDDPALRIWLASIWAALGEWGEARVDLRRAYEMTKDDRLKKYIDLDLPPKKISLIMYGQGPIVQWQEGEQVPVFLEPTDRPDFWLGSGDHSRELIFYNSYGWYKHQSERNNLMRDLLQKSNYMAQFLGSKTETATMKMGAKSVTTTIKVAGIATGIAIAGGGLYLASLLGASEATEIAIAAGLGAFYVIYKYSDRLGNKFRNYIEREERNQDEQRRNYRFLRYMPNWVALNFSEKDEFSGNAKVSLKAPKSFTTVHFYQFGDLNKDQMATP